MEGKNFRTLLLIFAAIIIVPVINSIYGTIHAAVTGIFAIIAIIIIILYFATRTESKALSKGICEDIKSINININGRNYIISESEEFNTEDHGQDGILSYIENGVWNISDNPAETIKGAVAEITIPEGITLDAFNVTVHSGNVLINSVSALLTNVNVHSDYAQIKALRTNKLNAVSGKGELTIDTVLSGDAQLQCGSGKLTVNFADSADSYSINASTGNGTIEINGETVFDSADRTGTVNADAPHSINARCGLGKLSMNFTEAVCNEEN